MAKKKVNNTSKIKKIAGSNQYVLMADIINSSQYGLETLKLFRKQIDKINNEYRLKSPLTITLGDEFQGLTTSLHQGIRIIFELEKKLLEENSPFKLRYALGFGRVLTPINSEIAHGMYGEALTSTRMALEGSKNNKRSRFLFLLPDMTYRSIFNNLFQVYQSFIDGWGQKDYETILLFHKTKDYKQVAKLLNKSRNQIWKREKNLRIREFFSLKNSILGVLDIYESSIHMEPNKKKKDN